MSDVESTSMLERVDRIQMAVAEAAPAARALQDLLGAEAAREDDGEYLQAHRTILTLGASEVVNSTLSAMKCARSAATLATEKPAMSGLVGHLYEVTNTIVSPWEEAARYARLFGLDPARFSPTTSDRFGYTGTLTLFDPPGRLDRIEISTVTDPQSAMGRWAAKRGDSLYMCYAETEDVGAIVRRLTRRHARFTPRGGDPLAERDGLWIHPSARSGLLLGVSRATVAWERSGRPELFVH